MHERVGAPATWVLSNHDVTRPATRYGRTDTGFAFDRKRFGTPSDTELGSRRARAAALLAMALPGAYYLYQGEELGLPEVEVPLDRIDDPMHQRSHGVDPGRDGCRVPLPWSGTGPPYGFTSGGAEPWLPQPPDWAALTVEAQQRDPGSVLSLFRAALRLRRDLDELGDGLLAWLDLGPEVIAFRRGERFASVTAFARDRVPLPDHAEVLATSSSLDDGTLPADTTAWLRLR